VEVALVELEAICLVAVVLLLLAALVMVMAVVDILGHSLVTLTQAVAVAEIIIKYRKQFME
jgi:hypothetical protein